MKKCLYYTSHCLSQRRRGNVVEVFAEYDPETLSGMVEVAIVSKRDYPLGFAGGAIDAEAVLYQPLFFDERVELEKRSNPLRNFLT